MADAVFDDKEWTSAFAMLRGEFKESLARRMGVSGGRILRDEAKRRAKRDAPPPTRPGLAPSGPPYCGDRSSSDPPGRSTSIIAVSARSG